MVRMSLGVFDQQTDVNVGLDAVTCRGVDVMFVTQRACLIEQQTWQQEQRQDTPIHDHLDSIILQTSLTKQTDRTSAVSQTRFCQTSKREDATVA